LGGSLTGHTTELGYLIGKDKREIKGKISKVREGLPTKERAERRRWKLKSFQRELRKVVERK